MAARVYIAWCKHEKEFGRIWKFTWTQAAGEGLHICTFKFDQTLSSVCIRLYKPWAVIFYFFYKTRLGNMMWRHNRVCIAWYKHGNWPITACVRHDLFYKHRYQLPRNNMKAIMRIVFHGRRSVIYIKIVF